MTFSSTASWDIKEEFIGWTFESWLQDKMRWIGRGIGGWRGWFLSFVMLYSRDERRRTTSFRLDIYFVIILSLYRSVCCCLKFGGGRVLLDITSPFAHFEDLKFGSRFHCWRKNTSIEYFWYSSSLLLKLLYTHFVHWEFGIVVRKLFYHLNHPYMSEQGKRPHHLCSVGRFSFLDITCTMRYRTIYYIHTSLASSMFNRFKIRVQLSFLAINPYSRSIHTA